MKVNSFVYVLGNHLTRSLFVFIFVLRVLVCKYRNRGPSWEKGVSLCMYDISFGIFGEFLQNIFQDPTKLYEHFNDDSK